MEGDGEILRKSRTTAGSWEVGAFRLKNDIWLGQETRSASTNHGAAVVKYIVLGRGTS